MSFVGPERMLRKEARMIRLPLVMAVTMASLALLGDSAQAGRMWMPKTENPYCDVTTYTLRDLPEQAMSMRDSNGNPVIVVSGFALAEKPSYSRFLLAHECCHHTLGHMDRFNDKLGQVGPQRFFFVAPALKQMELDADCCAVKLLKSRNQADSIEAAEEAMIGFGPAQTGAHYPTGTERAENITRCLTQD